MRRLPRFFREPVTPGLARQRLRDQLARRERSFVTLIERAVFDNPTSPYVPLFRAAGVERGDVTELVGEHGLEGALGRLFEAGVRVTLDEFKGRSPIERPGLTVRAGRDAFDNPLLEHHFSAATGGSRGARRRVSVDLDLLEHESAYHLLLHQGLRSLGRPFAVWRPVLPSSSGINNCLRHAKVGEPVSAWFNPYRPPLALDSIGFRTFTRSTVALSKLYGAGIAAPEHAPPESAERVARWLADRKREGRPAVLDTQTALGVRVSHAATAGGIDIAGSVLGLGGEPYTEQKAAAIAASGCSAYATYSMTETGRIAVACGEGAAHDDMHLLSDKLAVLQRERPVDAAGRSVPALHYTSLLASAPKVMINVESDDYGVLSERACGCPLGEVGLTLHVRDVRSYEKLTAEGNHFLGADVVELVDRVLPHRFGGGPTDYQLVEEEEDGLPRVTIVARPGIGPLDEQAVVAAVLDHLGADRRNHLMVQIWRTSGTLRLVRREPSVSASGKILPLHLARPR